MRRAALLLFTVGALVAAAPSAWAQQALLIREVDPSDFPNVSVTVSLQEPRALTPGDVAITEDGRPPEGEISLRSLEESGVEVEVVLAIDTSGSMQGDAMAAAIGAGRRFVRGLPAATRVGVVAFAAEPVVMQELTTDHGEVLATLGTLEPEGGTALYDAIRAASGLFSDEGQANILLLSDGGDTVSESDLASAVGRAEAVGAAIFAIGLRTDDTDVGALQTLARSTDGRYAPADAADLESIYAGLATELSNQYRLTYTSSSQLGQEVSVSVTVDGATDQALVLFPPGALPTAAPPQPDPVPAADPLIGGVPGLAVVLGLTFVAVFSLGVMLLGASARQQRAQELARRVARSRTPARDGREEAPEGRGAWLPEGLVAAAQRAAEASGFDRGLDAKLERAGLPVRPGEFVVGVGVSALLGALVGAALGKTVLIAVLGVLGLTFPYLFLSLRVHRRISRFEAQLADILMLLASSLRAGHSFLQALDMVAQEMADPGGHEFSRVVAEIRLGRPTDEALNGVVERIGSEDLKWAVMAVNIQREVGGNLAEILDTVAETIRDREAIRRQVRVLATEGRLSAWILSILPFGFVLYLYVFRPEYLALLFSDPVGIAMVVGGAVFMLVGILWMRKMVNIDV